MYYPNSNDWWLDPSQGRFDIRANGGAPLAALNAVGYLGIGTTYLLFPLQLRAGTDINLTVKPNAGALNLASLNDVLSAFVPFRIEASNILLMPTGNVGIGTASPAAKLQIIGVQSDAVGAAPYLGFDTDGAVPIFGFRIGTDSNMYLDRRFSSSSFNMMSFTRSNGNVGIGTTASGQELEVSGIVQISGSGNGLRFPDNSFQTTAASVGTLVTARGGKGGKAGSNGGAGGDSYTASGGGGFIYYPSGGTNGGSIGSPATPGAANSGAGGGGGDGQGNNNASAGGSGCCLVLWLQ